MKYQILFILCINLLFFSTNSFAQNSFITTWQTTAANETITIPTDGTGYSFTVDWGDGSAIENFSGMSPSTIHTFANAGNHTIKIDGTFPRIKFNNIGDKDKIININQWGNIHWANFQYAFQGCINLESTATDSPDLSGVISCEYMFSGALKFNGDLSSWDVSTITNMQLMFYQATKFNSDISNWDVANVQFMQEMFQGATAFNQSLGNWKLEASPNLTNMLDDSGLSTNNYDATLIGWEAQNGWANTPVSGLTLGALNLDYCLAENARTTLTDPAGLNWTISGDAQNCSFITTWETTAANESITIPTAENVVTGTNYDFMVDWGDGSASQTYSGSAPLVTHAYVNTGNHTIKIDGDFPRIYFNNAGDKDKILSIDHWGDMAWDDMYNAFKGCTNLVCNATDSPNLSNVTRLEYMFSGAINFTGDLSNWDVSTIANMANMFYQAYEFNSDISNWNVSSVIDMKYMFFSASKFNSDISNWNVSNVTNLQYMFFRTKEFNSDISSWNVGNVTKMQGMFFKAEKFNQNISGWDVRNVDDMNTMFRYASAFNQDLGSWKLEGSPNLALMLNASGLSTANYDNTLIGWAAQNGWATPVTGLNLGATGMKYCLSENSRMSLTNGLNWTITGDALDCAAAFITTWATTSANESIKIPTAMGSDYDFRIDWGDGTLESIVGSNPNPSHSFAQAENHTIKIVGDFPRILLFGSGEEAKILSIDQWGSQKWTSMEDAFAGCENLNGLISDVPDLSTVANMNYMFAESSFNQPINNWDVSAVTDMSSLFEFNTAFNQPLNNWNVQNVTTMTYMFYDSPFNQSISNWDVSAVTDMSGMFEDASAFNQSLGTWNLSSADDMSYMLNNSGLDGNNYDNTLIGWESNTNTPSDITLGSVGRIYCASNTERQNLIDNKNWTFTGDNPCAALPIELIYFEAHQKDQSVRLTWETQSELNNSGFDIQKSKDGINWNSIGWVAGSGTARTPSQYTFTDKNPFAKANYYRLKQIDFDDQFKYSPIADVYFSARPSISIYPNPTDGQITIAGLKDTPSIQISNALGQSVLTTHETNIDISHLPKGIYTVEVQSAEGVVLEMLLRR